MKKAKAWLKVRKLSSKVWTIPKNFVRRLPVHSSRTLMSIRSSFGDRSRVGSNSARHRSKRRERCFRNHRATREKEAGPGRAAHSPVDRLCAKTSAEKSAGGCARLGHGQTDCALVARTICQSLARQCHHLFR